MSLRLIRAAGDIESSDAFHEARLLLLLEHAAGNGEDAKPIEGIMKLAKLDFFVRYPNCLSRALEALPVADRPKRGVDTNIPEEDRNTIEARMIRFRYGPWDMRYRRWLGVLAAKGLIDIYASGRTVHTRITSQGRMVAASIMTAYPEHKNLGDRCRLVVRAFSDMGATKLKNFVYQVIPELNGMQWGEEIEL
jgi:hypothetical protein